MRFLINFIKRFGNVYVDKLTKHEYATQGNRKLNERPVEYAFVFNILKKYYPNKILDVGTGITALPHLLWNCGCHVTAADNIKDYWTSSISNRHFHVMNDDITNSALESDKFDMVTCVSTLEHIVNFNDAVFHMFRVLKPGGLLLITCPYTEGGFIENVYDLPDTTYIEKLPYKASSYCRKNIMEWCNANNAVLIEEEYWKFYDGRAWTIGQRLAPPILTGKDSLHQIGCFVFRKS